MLSRFVCVLVVVGCGRVHFDPTTLDASGEVLGPFGPATLVPMINSAGSDDDPTLTADMLEIIFDAEAAGVQGDLVSATRSNVGDPWSAPTVIAELTTADEEDGPCLSPDGLTITFSSNRTGVSGGHDLYVSTRPSRTSPWSPPQRIVELAGAQDEKRLTVTSDLLIGVFYSDRNGLEDLFEVRRADRTQPWSVPVPQVLINSTDRDADPALDASGTTLVFSSIRSGDGQTGLYITQRATVNDQFGPIVPIAELDTADDEGDPWISPDLRTIYFTRGAGTDRAIYMATR